MQSFPSLKKQKETKEETTSTSTTENEEENETPDYTEDPRNLEFKQFVREAIVTLDKISEERKRLPWWERTLLYLKSVWGDEPIPSRSPSRLLFWHTEAEEGHHISNTPRANGEYVVSYDNVPTFHKPHRSMRSFVTLLRNVVRAQHFRDHDHGKLDSPPENRKLSHKIGQRKKRKGSSYIPENEFPKINIEN